MTAYEMRISDWSSDVCSSDLGLARCERTGHRREHDDVLIVEGRVAERDRPTRIGFERQLALRTVGDAAVAAVAIVEIEFGEHAAHAEFGPCKQRRRALNRLCLAD